MSERRRRNKSSLFMGKDSQPTNSYDPQIGAASQEEAQTAQQAVNFSEGFYNNTLAPLVQQETAASAQSMGEQQQLFGLNYGNAQQQQQEYQQYGLPATTNYYNQANAYSAPAQQAIQAGYALGDQRSAEQNQNAQLTRSMESMGVSPNSPQALALKSQAGVANSANEAAAMNRARQVASTMGLQIAGNEATFANTGSAGIMNFGNSASGNANSSAGIAGSAIGAASGAQSGVLQGLGIANSAYGNNLSAYTSLGNTSMQLNQQSQAALGQGIGGLLGAGMSAAGNAGGFGALFSSDRRLKLNIVPIGQLASGLTVYSFDYVWGGPKQTGVMADEVEKVFPEAVVKDAHGFKMVDYSRIS
jgi:hypothetical protein